MPRANRANVCLVKAFSVANRYFLEAFIEAFIEASSAWRVCEEVLLDECAECDECDEFVCGKEWDEEWATNVAAAGKAAGKAGNSGFQLLLYPFYYLLWSIRRDSKVV